MLTPTRQLIEIRLDGDLGAFVDGLLAEGCGWRRIAREVRYRTGITVSHETIRSWFPDKSRAA